MLPKGSFSQKPILGESNEMFIGRYTHTIDPKGRLVVPQRLREVSASGYTTEAWNRAILTVPPQRDSIHLYLEETWNSMMQAVSGGSAIPNQEAMKLQRLTGCMTQSVECDKLGRIVLPADLKEMVGLDREALWIGATMRAEIWNPETWQAYFEENQADLCRMWDEYSRIGAADGTMQSQNVQLPQEQAAVE